MLDTRPAIEFAGSDEIRKYQDEKLCIALAYVATHSTYYRDMFKRLNIDYTQIKTYDDLCKLPVTTKSDLAKNNHSFICVEDRKIIDYLTTSGTDGDPVTFVMTDADLERLAYNEAISFACANCTADDIIQLTTTIDKRFMAGMAYFLGARKLGAGVIRVGAGIPELQWDSIKRFNPSVLVAVPSFILKLIDFAEKNSIDYANSSIKKIICIGEPIRKNDFSFNTLGGLIHSKWNVQLFGTYASTEKATAFTECECGVGGHHHPELIIVEFLDDDNNRVAKNEAGEVTITTLGVEGMPLVRYKTGDICYHYEEKCACGRTSLRLGPVIGRKKQMIKYKGTTLFPSSIHEVLNAIPELDAYIIEVFTNEIGTDDILIKISLKDDLKVDLVKELKDHFRAKLRVAPTIEIIDILSMQKMQFKESSRKPITFIDHRI